jgi:hypothetical protein
MEAADEVQLLTDFREGADREGDGAILLAFAVVDGEEHGVEVEAGPFVIVRTFGRRHPSPFQPPFKGHPCVSGNLLHRKEYDAQRPRLGRMWGW